MKKKAYLAGCICAALMLTSCYTSEVYVGKMKPGTPAVKVNTKHNSHFIGGLIGKGKARGKDYVDGAKDYMVKHQITFLDYVLSSVTMFIYTPSTTKFYVPLNSKKSSSKKRSRDYDDDEDE